MLSATLLHCEVIFPFAIYQEPVGRSFEATGLSCSLTSVHLHEPRLIRPAKGVALGDDPGSYDDDVFLPQRRLRGLHSLNYFPSAGLLQEEFAEPCDGERWVMGAAGESMSHPR